MASKELGKAAVKLCEQLKDVVHMLEGKQKDSKKKKALITGAKVLKVLKPSLSASLESCRRNMTSLTLTIAALVKVRFCRYRFCATGELKYRGAVG